MQYQDYNRSSFNTASEILSKRGGEVTAKHLANFFPAIVGCMNSSVVPSGVIPVTFKGEEILSLASPKVAEKALSAGNFTIVETTSDDFRDRRGRKNIWEIDPDVVGYKVLPGNNNPLSVSYALRPGFLQTSTAESAPGGTS